MGKSSSKLAKPAYTLEHAFADISTSPPEWSDRTRKEYKARLLRITKIAMAVSGMLDKGTQTEPEVMGETQPPAKKKSRTSKNSSQPVPSDTQQSSTPIETTDLIELFGSVDIIDKIGNAITQESRARGTVKDYMQALSSLARKSSPDNFGTRFPFAKWPTYAGHLRTRVTSRTRIYKRQANGTRTRATLPRTL
jgi:hypothetical protein